MTPNFRVLETSRYVAGCGHPVEYRVCEELVAGRWEGFVSGGGAPGNVCWSCYRGRDR